MDDRMCVTEFRDSQLHERWSVVGGRSSVLLWQTKLQLLDRDQRD